MVIRKTFLFLVVLVLYVPALAFAAPDVSLTSEGKVPGGPFDYLQEQIDNIQLTPGPQGPQGDPGPAGADGATGPAGPTGDPASFTPPVITHDAPASVTSADLTAGILSINFTVTDETEVAYYVIQDAEAPANNRWVVMGQGLSAVAFTVEKDIRVAGTNPIMIMAADMEGSISKTLVEVFLEDIVATCDEFVPGANLSGCYLSFANLSGVNLTGANLSQANLQDADLSGANLSGCDLSFANLSFANLNGAFLDGAFIRDANLSFANLSGASIQSVDLEGTNMLGADLTGAFLMDVQWSGTICPDGTNSDMADGDGFTCDFNLF